MRQRQFNRRCPQLTSRDVYAFTEHTLCQYVRLHDHGPKCTATVLCAVLVWAAARMASIAAVCRRWNGGPSDQAVYDALRDQLPKRPRILENRLHGALGHRLPRALFRRARQVAIDYHDVTYHGQPLKHANELRRSKPKHGTTTFHTYATVCIVQKGHRFTLAFTWVKRRESATQVVDRLLGRVRALGVRIRRVLLDRGFYSAAVMAELQRRRVPFVLPVVLRGRKPKPGTAAKGMRVYRRKPAGWYAHTFSHQGEPVRFSVCVAYKSYRHHRTRTRRTKKLIYAAWGVKGAPVWLRETYRLRFGIETSYRQRREARIRTCTRDPKLRLLYVGLSLLLRNVWVWVHAQSLSEGDRVHPTECLEKLRFSDLLEWVSDYIKAFLRVMTDYEIDCHTGKRVTAGETM